MLRGRRMLRTVSIEESLQDPGPNSINALRYPGPEADQVFVTQELRQILVRNLGHLPADNRRAVSLRKGTLNPRGGMHSRSK